jgi:Cys-tRNA(Pro)/Cys-tRNA(Cys) deacylase
VGSTVGRVVSGHGRKAYEPFAASHGGKNEQTLLDLVETPRNTYCDRYFPIERSHVRMKDALDVHRSLLAREVPHEIVRLPRAVSAADEIPEALGLASQRCVVVRMYVADDRPVAVIVRAGTTPHPGAVLTAARARSLRPARAEMVNDLTDFAAPLVSPFLLPESVTVLADACIGHSDVVYAPTGDSGTAVGIASRWLLTASRAAVTELCLPEAVDTATDDLDAEFAAALRPRHWR